MQSSLLYQQIQIRLQELAQCASGLIPSVIPIEPRRGDVMAIADDDLRVIASKVDAVVEAYALYVEQMTGYRIDRTTMVDQLSGALEGNLTFEISCAADDVHERNTEAVA